MQFLFKVEQFVAFRLHHLLHRYACPAGYHLGDVVLIDFLFYQCLAVNVLQRLLRRFYVGFRLLQLAVAYLGDFAVVAFALRHFRFVLQLLLTRFLVLDGCHIAFLLLPLGVEFLALLVQGLELVGYDRHFLLVVLPLDGLALYLQLLDLPVEVVEVFGLAVHLQTQFGCGLVHKVDGLVRQEPVGDVPRGERHGGDERVVLDADAVVCLVFLFQAAQDGYGRSLVRLIDHHFLEPALQRLVGLEVFLVLVQCGGADGAQFAAREGGFQDVGGIHRAGGLACSHQRMDFVDEEDYLSVGVYHFLYHAFQTLLELALVFGAGYQRAHVERVYLLFLQVLRHVTAHDTVCQAFGYGGLAHARLAYQHGVVLRPARQYLQHAADFVIAAYHGVQFAFAGAFAQVDGELLKVLIFLIGSVHIVISYIYNHCF